MLSSSPGATLVMLCGEVYFASSGGKLTLSHVPLLAESHVTIVGISVLEAILDVTSAKSQVSVVIDFCPFQQVVRRRFCQ